MICPACACILCHVCLALQAVYDGEGWISVGFSDDGRMVPADAVIGLPDEATALEYFLTNKVRRWEKRRADTHLPSPSCCVQLEAAGTLVCRKYERRIYLV